MDRQRSFCFKPTRLLLFSLTLSSSLLLCFFLSSITLSGYSTLFHEKTHIQLGSLLETAAGESFLDFPGDDHNGTALEGDGRGEKADPGSTSTHQEVSDNSTYAHIHGSLVSSEDSDSFLEMKDPTLERTHFSGSVSSTEKPGHSSKVDSFSFPYPREEARKAGGLEGGSSSGDASRVNLSQLVVRNPKIEEGMGTCDIYKGRWVFDESYPLYTNKTCPFIDEGFSCQSNGRPDMEYMKWRWQPSDCNFPRFNAVKLLEMIRGKRLVFAGDSINRNQWESLLCMLRQGISDPNRMYEARGRRITKSRGTYNFKFPDYKCSVEYYLTHFLVREGKARIGKRRVSTLQIDSVDRSSSRWKQADILVFNTAHWWSHHKTKTGRNYFQEGDLVHPQLDVATAFRKALQTWASWIDRHVDPRRTMVFFRSSSPSHFSGGEWNSGGHCWESTRPLNKTPARRSPKLNVIVKQVLSQMKTPVTVLNVTATSGFRVDAHPSIYGRKPGGRSSRSVQDCSHWCLPGVPDVWNEFLYYNLLFRQTSH